MAVALVMAAASLPSAAAAGQVTATMPVTLVVHPACRASTSPLAFEGDAGSVIDAEAQIAVACNGEVPLAVSLDAGAHAGGAERRLAGNDGYVAYALYRDPARSMRWDAGAAVTETARGGRLELTAYGRVEPGATFGADGTYSDTVVVTVDF